MEEYHDPVLLREVLEALDIKKDRWYFDGTLGDGGHALGILNLGGKVLGIDVDPVILNRARERLLKVGVNENRFLLKLGNFRSIKNIVSQTGIVKFNGVLLDLGVSSLQLDSPDRGFSFSKKGPLDMRMDPELKVTASDLINGLNKGELDELFTKLGDEKLAKRIADAVVIARQVKRIETTLELADIVAGVYKKYRIKIGSIHPATRVFQALRIAVNDELNGLRECLPQVLRVLNPGGRVVAVSFHSLEDRIVKNAFRGWKSESLGQVITKKPVVPRAEEVTINPRSRSAKMRVFEKII